MSTPTLRLPLRGRLKVEQEARKAVAGLPADRDRSRALRVARIGGEMGYWAAEITRGANIRGCATRLDELGEEMSTMMREDGCTEDQITELVARLRSTERRGQ